MPCCGPGVDGAHRAHRQPVAEQQVVDRAGRQARVALAGRMDAGGVTQQRRAPRLVERRPLADAIVERLEDDGRVVPESVGGVARRPPTGVLERLRQVPVVERDDRVDAGGEQLVDQAAVEAQARLVERTDAGRLDPRPGDAEAVGLQAQVDA